MGAYKVESAVALVYSAKACFHIAERGTFNSFEEALDAVLKHKDAPLVTRDGHYGKALVSDIDLTALDEEKGIFSACVWDDKDGTVDYQIRLTKDGKPITQDDRPINL